MYTQLLVMDGQLPLLQGVSCRACMYVHANLNVGGEQAVAFLTRRVLQGMDVCTRNLWGMDRDDN